MKRLLNISGGFDLDGATEKVEPFGSGHINDTYRIDTAKKTYLLQRVNHSIFKNVEGLTTNLLAVTEYLRERTEPPMQVLHAIPARNGKYIIQDEGGNYWRVFDFVSGSHSYDLVPGRQLAGEGGRAYGWFVRMLTDFPVDSLVETIPDFHNAASRIGRFMEAVENDPAGRVQDARPLIDQLLARSGSMMRIHDLGMAQRIPLRVTHNDTKINNVLFNDRDEGICVIDLDTVMPGYVHFDFGDAIRTFTNSASEDEHDPGKISFNIDFYKAFARGFLAETRAILTREELDTLAFSPLYITYEQTIRFLTDYLQGDTYYKIRYPDHNLVRSKAQFRLLELMESQGKEMEEVIRKA